MTHADSRSRSRRSRRHRPLVLEPLERRIVLAAPYPLNDTFLLESNPGADHSIYLDFDGHITTGTTWNSYYNQTSITSPAYDRDGNSATFSNSELEEIQKIWQRVAEDFSAFDVNVTTKDPTVADPGALFDSGGTDTTWGVRAVMTVDNFASCGCGGFAFLNSFTDSVDEPVFVFNGGETGAAETISHEVGHSLGLHHDGQGTNTYYTGHSTGGFVWAPIMGAGFTAQLTQWSKGEYNGATSLEDDLAIITNTANGFGYRGDDHAGTNANATPITMTPNLVDAQGIIETSSDVDVFSFHTDGTPRNLLIVPADRGANLDIRADIYDDQGTFIGTSDHPGTLYAGGTLTLPAGDYFMHISGTGYNDPATNGYSDYASIGQYFIRYEGNQAASIAITPLSADKPEGTGGSNDFTFTVTRSGNVAIAGTVDYSVVGSGTFAAKNKDFVGNTLPSGTVSFSAGQTSATISLPVKTDKSKEADETFEVQLGNPTAGLVIDAGTAEGVIQNDDGTVLAMVAVQAELSEGNTGATPFTFEVLRFGDTSGISTANFAVESRGGRNVRVSPDDFVGNVLPSGSVTFQPGQTSRPVTIQVQGDGDNERDEKFRVKITSSSGADRLVHRKANGLILNDDAGQNAGLSHDDEHDEDADHDHDHDHGLHDFFAGRTIHHSRLIDDSYLFESDDTLEPAGGNNADAESLWDGLAPRRERQAVDRPTVARQPLEVAVLELEARPWATGIATLNGPAPLHDQPLARRESTEDDIDPLAIDALLGTGELLLSL